MKYILFLFFCLSAQGINYYSFELLNENNTSLFNNELLEGHPLTKIFNDILDEEAIYIAKNIKITEDGEFEPLNNDERTINHFNSLTNHYNGKTIYKNLVKFPANKDAIDLFISHYPGGKNQLILNMFLNLMVTVESIREVTISKIRYYHPSRFLYNFDETKHIVVEGHTGFPAKLHHSSGDTTLPIKISRSGGILEDYQYTGENFSKEKMDEDRIKAFLAMGDLQILEKNIRNILKLSMTFQKDYGQNIKYDIYLKRLAFIGELVYLCKIEPYEFINKVYEIYRLLSKYIQDHPMLIDSFNNIFKKNIIFLGEISQLQDVQKHFKYDLIPIIVNFLIMFQNIASGDCPQALSNYKYNLKNRPMMLQMAIDDYNTKLSKTKK